MDLQQELVSKRMELEQARLEQARLEQARPEELAREVASLEAQQAERNQRLNENLQAQAHARGEAAKRVASFQDHIKMLLQGLKRTAEELGGIAATQQAIANLKQREAVLRGLYGDNPTLWPRIDYSKITGVDPWGGLGEITSTEVRLLQIIGQRLGPKLGERIRGLHHAHRI